MRSRIDLYLLRDAINQLSEMTYFSKRLHDYAANVVKAIDYVLTNESDIAPDILRSFGRHVQRTYVYLAGSTTKEAPYEMEYCLAKALDRWVQRDTIITTALTNEHDFHLLPADPWGFIKSFLPGFDTQGYDPLLVQLGLPRLYRHKPLYCLPLYHELGHFVDEQSTVTSLSMVAEPALIAIERLGLGAEYTDEQKQRVESRHRKEYFSDLFAAAHVGRPSVETLVTIAPSATASATHPSTADRVELVDIFLDGRTTPLIDLFQQCLTQQDKPALTKIFTLPTMSTAFDDLRPYETADEPELHGTLSAAWTYLNDCLDNRRRPWIRPAMSDADIERITNDLTEKTIRNASIRERWTNGATA